MNGRAAPVLAALLALAGVAGCGRSRRENVPPGDVRVVQRAPSSAETTRTAEAAVGTEEPVSAEEAARRARVRRLAERLAKAKNAGDRADVLDMIGRLGPGGRDLLPAVAALCDDGDADVRSLAVKAAADVGGVEAAPQVLKAAVDAAEPVRLAAAQALAVLPAPDNWTQALRLARAERAERVQEALVAVAEGAEGGAPAAAVAELLRERAGADGAPLAVAAAKRAAKIFVLRPAEAKGAAEVLATYLGRPDADARALVAQALGRIDVRSTPVKVALAGALTDPEAAVRREAFLVLKRWAEKDFGYAPDAEEFARRPGVLAFRTWAETP